MLQPAKVATPLVAASGLVVHDKVAPLPGWVLMAKVIEAFELVPEVTVLPPESSTVTTGWVPKTAPLAESDGLVVTTILVAGPTVMLKVALVLVRVSVASVAVSV